MHMHMYIYILTCYRWMQKSLERIEAVIGSSLCLAGDVPATHVTNCLSGRVRSHACASRAVARPVAQKAQVRHPTRRTYSLPPGKETHNHPYPFMTIPVSGDTTELPKNPGNSSRNEAHVHRNNWGTQVLAAQMALGGPTGAAR